MNSKAVVADTGPIHYLVLIDQISVLPFLFETVLVPDVVRTELIHAETPSSVRQWITTQPPWLEVRSETITPDTALKSLDAGESAVISLALSLGADLILMDDRAGVAAARGKGFVVTGTLGLLDLAARRRLLDLSEAFARLRATSFRCRPELFEVLLVRHQTRYGD